MPTTERHLWQVVRNRNLLALLDPETTLFLEWVVTVIFYTALHLVEARLAKHNLHMGTHADRDNWIQADGALRYTVWPLYKELEDYSHEARYQCVGFDRNHVVGTLLEDLERIDQAIRPLLGL